MKDFHIQSRVLNQYLKYTLFSILLLISNIQVVNCQTISIKNFDFQQDVNDDVFKDMLAYSYSSSSKTGFSTNGANNARLKNKSGERFGTISEFIPSEVITFDDQEHVNGTSYGNPYTIVNGNETFVFTLSGGGPTNHVYRTTETFCANSGFNHLSAGTSSQTTWTIETQSGNEINLGTIDFHNIFTCFAFTYKLTIEGFKNGISTGAQSFDVVTGFNNVFNSNSSFDDVDKIVITAADISNLGIDDIEWISNASASTAPTVTTSAVTNITSSEATFSGEVTGDGGATVTERGFVYGTETNPTTSNTKVQEGTEIGSFSEVVTGLIAGTTYYVRAYAINSEGTSYGVVESFTTSPPVGLSANDVSTCSGSEVTLTATGTGTIKWYDAATGGNLLFQGATFVTPALLSNTTYYLQDDNFSGTRTPVNVTILFGSICGSVIDNVFTLKLPSGGTTIFDLNTLISGNKLTLIVANTQNSLVLASDVNGISTNGTSTITVDLGEFSTFAGLSVLGNSGTDLVTIGVGGLDFSELPGADNQLININLSSATDQLTVFGPIKTKGTGDLYIQSGLGFDIGATLTTLDTLTIHSGGTVTQSSAISSKTLMLGKTGNTGTYILTNSSNNAVDLRAVATGSISYTDMDGIIVRNATTAGDVTISAGGNISVENTGIQMNSGSGSVELTNSSGTITIKGNGIRTKGNVTVNSVGTISSISKAIDNSLGSGFINMTSSTGGITSAGNGLRSNGNIILEASGRITISSSGVIGASGSGDIIITSTDNEVDISGQGVSSRGELTVRSKGKISTSGSSVRNNNGTGILQLISSEGGITTRGTGIVSRGDIFISAAGDIALNDGSTNNRSGTGNVRIITSSGSINTGSGGVTSKGKVTLSGTGDIMIRDSGVDNRVGTDSITVNSSAGKITINGSGIESKGVVKLNASGLISVSAGGVDNTYGTGKNILATSTSGKIELTGAGFKSKGNVYVEANNGVDINRGGVQNHYGTGEISIKSVTGQVSVFDCFNCSDADYGVKSLGQITIEADLIDLTGPVNANTNTVYVKPASNDMAIDLGGLETMGILGLSGTELGRITASEIIIGDENNTLEIVVNTALSTDLNLTLKAATESGTLNLKESLSVGKVDLSGISNYQTSILTSTTSNQLIVAESVQLGSGLTLELNSIAANLKAGDEILLIDNKGTEAVTGTFNDLEEGVIFEEEDENSNPIFFKISYLGGDGNDVVLEVMSLNLQIIVDSKSKTLGAKDPEFTVSYSSALGEIDLSKLIGDPVFDRESGETVGAYEITASGITSDFYEITYVAGNLAILGPPAFLSNPTVLEIGYGENYSYPVSASEEGDLETILSAPVLPSWLELSAAGASQSTVLASFQEGDDVMSIAGDGEGNIFAMTFDGTRIFKVAPDGTYDTWASGLSQKVSFSMAVDSEYLYIGVISFGEIQDGPALLRIPIANPSLGEEVWLTQEELGGAVLKVISKGDYIYATVFSEAGGLQKIHKQTKAIENYLSEVGPLLGFTFDENEDLYFLNFPNAQQDYGIFKYDGATKELLVPTESIGAFPLTIEKSQDGTWYISYINESNVGGVRKYVSDFSSFEDVDQDIERPGIFLMLMTPTGKIIYRDVSSIQGNPQQGTFEIYQVSFGATLKGVPKKSDIGDHPVTLRATNEAGSVDQEFVIRVVDKTSPVVTSFSPANNATEVELQPTLSITFDEEVVLGNSGIVKLGKVGIDGCTIESFLEYDLSDVKDRSVFELSGDKLTVSFKISENLPVNSQVIVEIPSGFVADLIGNQFAGFSAITYTWSFTTINKNEQTITFDEIENKTYGDAKFTLGDAVTDQGLIVTYTAEDPNVVSITGNQATILKVGSTKITAIQVGDEENFGATPVQRILNVDKATLMVTVNPSQIKVYGQSDPTFDYKVTGFVNEEEASNILTGTLSRDNGEEVGNYAINQGDLSSNDNYGISFTGADFTIIPATVTDVEFKDDSFVYDGTAKSLVITGELPEGTSVVYSNNSLTNVGSQTATATITGSNYTTQELTATLAITPATVTGVELKDANFIYDGISKSLAITGELPEGTSVAYSNNSITNVGSQTTTATIKGANYITLELTATLAITPATVTGVELKDASFVYDETSKSLAITGELPEGTSVAYSNNSITNVGSQTATATITGSNYTTLELTAILAITPATVTGVELKSTSFIYDGISKSLGITGELSEGTSVAYSNNSLTNVGTNVVTATISGLNYKTLTLSAELKVTPASVLITATDKSKVYGEANPALTFTYTGLVNGDTQVATEPSIATTATASSNVGTYPITLSGGVDANYDIILVNGTLTVGQKAVTITAENKSKVYGETNPALTFTYIGLVNGDTQTAIEPSISTAANTGSNVGTYPITLTGASDANYDITLVAGELEVTQANLTITADDKSKVYGEANPALTFTYSGLVNGDTQVTTEPSISTTATTDSNVGTYPITLTGASDANYGITLVDGGLEVTQATLTITANEGQSKVFGTADPVLSYSATGFAAGDDEQVLTGTLTRNAGEAVGTYPINLGSLAAGGNYQIVYTSADFEIIPAVIEAVMQPAPIETVWGVYPGLPSTVTVMTTDGQFLSLPITWDLQTLYVFGNGEYPLTASINLPSGILNTEALTVEIVVTVLPKPAPEDILLDNNSFEAEAGQNFIAVGNLTVIDPIDNQHDISLADLAFDNVYFQINNGTL
ncbi:MBG domain-containing protein, partial [Belliella aquatica]